MKRNEPVEIDLTSLLQELAVIILVGWLGISAYLRLSSSPQATPLAATPTPVPATPIILHDLSQTWNVTWTDAAPLQAMTDQSTFRQRFPDGLELTVIDQPTAPEALRGSYDSTPRVLRFGAVWPQPTAGQVLRPEMEAWADCVRDFERGPSHTLRCYVFARGEPGAALNRLASSALAQAVAYVLHGRVSPDASWIPDDAFFSFYPSSSP